MSSVFQRGGQKTWTGIEPTTSCLQSITSDAAPQTLRDTAHHECTMRGPVQTAVARLMVTFGDMTSCEVSRELGIDPLVACRALRDLYEAGVVEPRERRRCRVLDRPMIAYILTPKANVGR